VGQIGEPCGEKRMRDGEKKMIVAAMLRGLSAALARSISTSERTMGPYQN
jgi:hypothetical protein